MLNIDLNEIDDSLRIEEICTAPLPYRRPRIAGKNARLDTHGWGGETPIAVIKAGGIEGFGWSAINKRRAEQLTGLPLRALFDDNRMLAAQYRCIEFPILDWLGNYFKKPVYKLAAKTPDSIAGKFSVPVYDTTIYFDELHIENNREALDFILGEVSEGLAAGHRNFKIKIGRGAMWMPLARGLERDIEIVNAVRVLIGDGKIMADANNGYNLNIAKEFLLAVKESNLYWLEEAFYEDNMLYANLKTWMKENNIKTLIADGEGQASPSLVDWAKKGLIDIIQYDLRGYGFFSLMELCRETEPFGILCAPHNYGGFYGNFACGHLAACTGKFALVEYDAADAEGIDRSAYSIKNGFLEIPQSSGFGLALDRRIFDKQCDLKGFKAKFGH
ncbi:MAG: hypothetical protein FWD78_00265 [Treponema sp.]|nr:hypothetical protein [Treponema sp.]